jgi:uncharacterized membrane protein YccC
MASANPSLPLPESSQPAQQISFWASQSSSLKQGIKTGLAGTITYAIYAIWHLPEGYWAVFTALVVTQVTLGAAWRAALYRTIGSTSGAVAAMLLITILGPGSLRVGIALLVLATLFGYLTVLHPSFSAAGFTAAIVLVIGGIEGSPIHVGWLRVLYTLLGSFVAFAVGALIWPVHAREALRHKIANILDGAGALYRAVTAAAFEGTDNEQQVRRLDHQLHDLRRGITQQMDEARSELSFSRFNHGAYQRVVEMADQLRRRLSAMAEDSSLFVHAQLPPQLVPSLPALAHQTAESFAALAEIMRQRGHTVSSQNLDAAIRNLDADLTRLREQRMTSPFALDRMLPFWGLVFNLREIAEQLKQLQSALPQLIGAASRGADTE